MGMSRILEDLNLLWGLVEPRQGIGCCVSTLQRWRGGTYAGGRCYPLLLINPRRHSVNNPNQGGQQGGQQQGGQDQKPGQQTQKPGQGGQQGDPKPGQSTQK